MPITQQQLPSLIDAFSKAKAETDVQGMRGEQEQQLSKLHAYLQAQQAAKEPELAGNRQAALNKANLDTMQSPRLQQFVNDGGSAKVGDLSIGADPMAKAYLVTDKGEESARQKAIANYNHALPKLQQTFQAATEGLNAVNDPKNIGSLGQARTLMLKSMGMNRYNENEAKAVLPPALQNYAAQVFNAVGGDEAPLGEAQRAAVNQFFQGQLHATKQQHDMLKQASLDTYDSSRYAAPTGHQTLQNRLGGGFSQALDSADKQYGQLPATQGPQLTNQPMPSTIDRLKSFFGVKPSAQQQSAPQVTQATHADAIAQELAKRAQGALNQPQQQQPQQGQ